ncbi:MAG TPA: tRNA (adenosine(37)-N6)-threonylcarbamoyltransferase complex ATPase subunit type 1 TsaE [Thermodesulfovibrionales bacterium]|nr:tRNA (adenosine(37)-N6)-threonylcarbamoyltransferase complex ATPase subunit type 1 TsaE [Thermodesulfovibrionales bacterium]
MYKEFYGLKDRPFSKTPDPRFLYLSRSHEEALARLHYAVEEKELILLTGEVGSGKTTLTRALMDSLGEKYRVIVLINPRLTAAQFLKTVAKRFDIDVPHNYRDSLLDAICEKVYKDYESGITPVIIIDEAQLIPKRETFEEIRLLTNFQLDDTNLLSLILVGQSDLRRKLNHKAYLPLRQRIGLFYHLGPLAEHEMKSYMEHRLKVSGLCDPLFTDEALQKLYRYSGGIPRLINSLATTALLDGVGREQRVIDGFLISEAARELGLNGYREN